MKNLFRSGLIVLSIVSTLFAKAQVPLLSSYPSATGVIYLDFDGQTVSGTSWNTNGPIYCGAAGLTSSQITEIFNRVSEDYRPFNVNITTDSSKYFAAPANMRTRVILTVTSAWYGSAGGVSFVGSFTWGDDTPCFVFTALLNYNTKDIAEAAAHEAGHTLGLYHQAKYDTSCNLITQYNPGQGTGEIGWAPIMGVGYYQNFTLWNDGPNPFGCSTSQSDLSIITTGNGFTYRADDYPATFTGAGTATFTNDQFNVPGIIEKPGDQDMFKFIIPTSSHFTLNAVPYNVGAGDAGSDLDMQVSLYNSSQTLLNVYTSSSLLSTSIDTSLISGTYYLKVEGKGNIYAPNYASLGSYTLQGAMSNIILPLRSLELRGSLNGDKHQLDWVITADEPVTKQILEISTDGINFSELVQPPVEDRSYTYKPYVTTTVQYRINATLSDGQQYYSNIISLKSNTSTARPQLLGNLVSNNIQVSSPGNFNFTLFDFTGKIVAKGLLTNGINTINASSYMSGMYLIRFDNGDQQWTDKLVRQ